MVNNYYPSTRLSYLGVHHQLATQNTMFRIEIEQNNETLELSKSCILMLYSSTYHSDKVDHH